MVCVLNAESGLMDSMECGIFMGLIFNGKRYLPPPLRVAERGSGK